MDIWKALRTVGRRWYIAFTVLNLCAAATAALVANTHASYTSGATLILLPPSLQEELGPGETAPVNPFLQTGIPMAQAVASAANSDRVADQLKAAGLGNVEFLVGAVEATPILGLTVESNSPETANAAIAVVVEAVQSLTRELQVEANSPPQLLITAQVLATPPGAPAESLAAKTKIAMAMVVASLFVVLCSALLFDRLALLVANRRQARAEEIRADATREVDDGELEVRDVDDLATQGAGVNGDEEMLQVKATVGR